jgi:hypothetical protein
MKIKDYIQGKRHGKEANQLEREAMNDSFLQDAIDGFDSVDGEHLSAIEQLEKQITRKSSKNKSLVPAIILSIAASLILLIGISSLMKRFLDSEPKLAHIESVNLYEENEEVTTEMIVLEDSIKSTATSKPLIAKQQQRARETQSKKTSTLKNKSKTVVDELMICEDSDLVLEEVEKEADKQLVSDSFIETTNIIETSTLRANAVDSVSIDNRKSIKGNVFDESNSPLAGVIIQVNNTNYKTISESNGYFNIQFPDTKNVSLSANYIGYEPFNISLKSDSVIIRLKPNNLILGEVAVAKTMSSKSFSELKAVSVDDALQGQIAGLESRARKYSFGKADFRKFFKENLTQGVCENKKSSLRAKFRLNENGIPTDIKIISSDCKELEIEFKRIIGMSPMWSYKNRNISITIRTSVVADD